MPRPATEAAPPLPTDPAERDAYAVVMSSFPGTRVPDWIRAAARAGLGSVCLFGSNMPFGSDGAADDARLRALTDDLHAASGPDAPGVLVAVDEEGGDVTRLDAGRGSDLPAPAAMGAVDDLDLTRAVAAGLGRRLRAAGIDLDLAPDADVDAEPRNPVIGVRSFGPDPVRAGRHVAAFVEELQAAGVAACPKHFPGHGDTAQDSHLALPQVTVPVETLRARELVPFHAAVAAGAEAVMTAHLLVPALDPDRPASTSAAVTGLLRDELGFTGVVVTDALDMHGVSGPDAHGGIPAAAVAALVAGADLLCIGAEGTPDQLHGVVGAVLAAVADGVLPRERLAEAAGRVRDLAARAAARRAAAPTPTAPAVAPAAEQVARRAVRVDGTLPPLDGALVVRFASTASIAVGAVPWGPAQVAPAAAGPAPAGLAYLDTGPDPDVAGLVARAAGRPLVAVVRDALRTPWVLAALTDLALARPDLVVVEMGRPGPEALPGAAAVFTAGASRASARAALAVLAGGR